MSLKNARDVGLTLVVLAGSACAEGDWAVSSPREPGSPGSVAGPYAHSEPGRPAHLDESPGAPDGEVGPKLVVSAPADGEDFVNPLSGLRLYFDRPVDAAAAQGAITAEGQFESYDPMTLPVQVSACDDDPACLECTYWETLPYGPMRVEVTIGKELPDTAGMTRGEDTTFSFQTYSYTDYFTYVHYYYADVAFMSGGIEYDPASRSLLVCAMECHGTAIHVMRIPLVDGVPEEALEVADVQGAEASYASCDGLELADGALIGVDSWQNRVFRFDDLDAPGNPEILNTTNLASPYHELPMVRSTASLGGALYFGSGGRSLAWLGAYADPPNALVRLDPLGVWEVWMDLKGTVNLEQGFNVGRGIEKGGHYLYLASDADATIYKIDVATRTIVNSQVLTGLRDAQLRTDSKGRLYVGTNEEGIRIFRTSGSDGFTAVGPSLPLAAGRFAIQEEGDLVHIYFLTTSSEPRIGKALFRLVD